MKKTTLKQKKTHQTDKLLVYAISSAYSDLLICQKINQWLKINLSLDTDHKIIVKNMTISFRRYSFEFEEGIEKYFLYVNENQGHFLFPELKKVDFILIIYTETESQSIRDLLQELKREKEFTVLYRVPVSSVKSLSKIEI